MSNIKGWKLLLGHMIIVQDHIIAQTTCKVVINVAVMYYHDRCLFCGIEQTVTMADHYLNCPMLTYCSHCEQVSTNVYVHCNDWYQQMVEISGLTDHLLGECEVHDQYHKCPRCGEAVHSSDSDNHHSCTCK